MKILPSMMSAASGSLAGITASHNKGGQYFRSRVIPVNPSSEFQLQVRAAMTSLATGWSDTLIPSQRTAWDLYASNVEVTDTLGSSMTLSGINWFIASNTARLQSEAKLPAGMAVGALPTVLDAPTIFDRGDFTTPVPSYTEASGLSIAFTGTDEWASEDGSALLVFQGRSQNRGVTFFKGPYRLVAVILGDSVTPPTSPFVVTPTILGIQGYVPTAGQSAFTAAAVTRADGRISSRRQIGPDLVLA